MNDAGTSVAIRVLDIDSEALTYDGKEYYLVKHENGVTPLQASAKDIQQLLDLKKENPEGWEPLKEANIYLNVRVTPAVTKGRRGSTTVHIPAVLLEDFATQYKKGTLLPVGDSLPLDFLHYLTLTSFINRLLETGFTLFVFLLALVSFYIAYRRVRTSREEYEVFDKEFPLYAQNMKALPMDADFIDPKLKVLVKDHKFVCYNNDFRVIKLREVRNVEVRRQKVKSSVTYAIDIAFGGNKKVTIQLKNRPENVRQLVEYLNEKEGTKISIPFQW
ncbi:hypothetical protein [Streptococcus sp. 263_SSPC]|uniref:hypothetical protein n=1 Tax=Streptococcus sp. 263_SSPC TaxID=1579343 RepID=UPI001364E28B|nr:hypothetical protein [Streptococcus sp. 263_SSPC]